MEGHADEDALDELFHELQGRPVDGTSAYEAWRTMFREALIEGAREDRVSRLINGLRKLHQVCPLHGVQGVTEQIGLFLLFRQASLAKVLVENDEKNFVAVLGSHSLGVQLPFMMTNIDAEEFSSFASNASCSKAENTKVPNVCRSFALVHEFKDFGPADRKLLHFYLKETRTRSASFLNILQFISSIILESKHLLEVDERVDSLTKVFLRNIWMLPPSIAALHALQVKAMELKTQSCEIGMSNKSTEQLSEVIKCCSRNLKSTMECNRREGRQRLSQNFQSNPLQRTVSRGSSKQFPGSRRKSQEETGSVKHNFNPTLQHYNPAQYMDAPSETKVAQVHGIWLQIDSSALAMEDFRPDLVSNEELTSVAPGTLNIFKNKISWKLNGDELGQSENSAEDDGKINHQQKSEGQIQALRNGNPVYDVRIRSERESEAETNENYVPIPIGQALSRAVNITTPIAHAFHRVLTTYAETAGSSFLDLFNDNKRETKLESFNSSVQAPAKVHSLPYSSLRRYTWGTLGSDMCFLALYTLSEVVKFYPFSRDEVTQIMAALADLTGLKPISIAEEMSQRTRRKIEKKRHAVQGRMITKWIHHTEDLWKTLHSLTCSSGAIKVVTLERLYHSARHNKIIVEESMKMLKNIWNASNSQETLLKVLCIVNRFLDGDILHGEDPMLADLLSWLHEIETTLDPYVYSRPLKMLINICQHAEILQTKTIIPMIESYYNDSVFEMKQDYLIFATQ